MSDLPTFEDLRAGRILAGETQSNIAHFCHVTSQTVAALERGDPVRLYTARAVRDALELAGIEFGGTGVVRKRDGHYTRRAPTLAAVGAVPGSRLRKAREALRLTPPKLALLAHVRASIVRKAEQLAWPFDEGVDPALAFAVFNALEYAGYRFGTNAGRDGLAKSG